VPSVWRGAGFRAYLGSTAFTSIAFSMQQLLVAWLLVGVLLLPGDQVGIAQAVIGIPGVFLMLWGGARADRVDPRSLLLRVYAVAPLVPLALALVDRADWLNAVTVTLWGLGMGFVMSFSSPAQAAILNRVAGPAIQQGVTAATAVGFLVQMLGLAVAGQMERVGLVTVLVVQAACLGIGALAIRGIPALPASAAAPQEQVPGGVLAGLRATMRDRVVASLISINFVSSIFNAGAFVTVLPFIIKRVYAGDAGLLAAVMIVFFAGATISNLVMLRYMPIAHPGRLFLIMQLSRVVLVYLLWIRPDFWLLATALFAWGLNMGVTSTLARAIVQESAPAEFRGRILAVFNVSLIGSAPLGAVLLGWIVETSGTLNALVPSMVVSVALFLIGIFFTNIWSYHSTDGSD
jgi:MFS family permease